MPCGTNARMQGPFPPKTDPEFLKNLLKTQNIKWVITPPNDNRTMAPRAPAAAVPSALPTQQAHPAYTAVSKMFFLFAVLAPLMNTNTETISKLLHRQGQRWEIALQVARAAKLKLLQWSSFVLHPSVIR